MYGCRLLCRLGISALILLLCRLLVAALLAIGALRGAFCVRAFAQELESVHYNFRCVALVSGLVRPLACAKVAFDKDLRAFADEFLHYVGIAAPHDYVVPFRVFAEIAVAVPVAFRCSKGEGCNFCIVARIGRILFEVTYFRVFSNVTDQHDFVQ